MKQLSIFIVLILCSQLRATEIRKPAEEARKGMHTGIFQLSGGILLDPTQRVKSAAAVAWTPTYIFSHRFMVRSSAGIVWRYAGSRDELRVADFSVTFIEKPKMNSPLYGEIGGGFQYWTGNSARKFYPVAKAGFGYQFGSGNSFLKSFQISYGYVFNDPLKAHQVLGAFTVGF